MSRIAITVQLLDDQGQPETQTKPLQMSFETIQPLALDPKTAFSQVENEMIALGFETFGRAHRRQILLQLMPRLWEGDVDGALAILESLRQQTRNPWLNPLLMRAKKNCQ